MRIRESRASLGRSGNRGRPCGEIRADSCGIWGVSVVAVTSFRPIRRRLSRLAKNRHGGTGATGAATCSAAGVGRGERIPWPCCWRVYRAGATVFGGGHVVLPLLQTAVVQSGTVSTADLLAGYGAAQAVPGPLFTFAAYLGAMAAGPLSGWAGGLTLLAVIFMPAVLVLVSAALLGVAKPPQGSAGFNLQASTPGSSGSCWQRCTTRCGRVRSMTDGMSRWRWLRSGYWSSRVHRRSWWCCWLPWRVGRWRGSQGICQSI